MQKIDRPVALVTGGGRGIGLGISKELLGEGFALAFCGVKQENEVASLKELREIDAGVLYARANIADRDDRKRLIETVNNHFGRLDVLVNNAGVAPSERKDLLAASEESYDRLMDINLKGPYFLTQEAANWMVEQKKHDASFEGCIIFITSISSTVASTNRGEYCLSKAGLSMACRLWAARLAEHDIPVYEIRPGIIQTDMTAGVKEKYDRLISEGLLLQSRWGMPQDVGKAAAMLSRGDLGYSTGQVIMVDGALTRNVL